MTVAVSSPVHTVEALMFEPRSMRGDAMFAALTATARAAGVQLRTRQTFTGGADLLLLWGPGAPNRFEPIRRQLAAGGHVAAFDLAYWSRERKVRCAIDGPHPQAWIFKLDWPIARWQQDPAPVFDRWNPEGPVIVAGIGTKAKIQYGADVVEAWERLMIAACQAQGRTVFYRPKPGHPSAIDLPQRNGAIEHVLAGASLVVTWHSNVAVDAIRLGIPVVCRDGAAAAVCPPTIDGPMTPLPNAVRDRFLKNLAWFQWAPSEASAWWRWIQEILA